MKCVTYRVFFYFLFLFCISHGSMASSTECYLLQDDGWWNKFVRSIFNGNAQHEERLRRCAQEDARTSGVIDSCKQAIRSTVKASSTLRFAGDGGAMEPWSVIPVNRTEGGYKANLHGSTSNGSFSAACYTNNTYTVTNLSYE